MKRYTLIDISMGIVFVLFSELCHAGPARESILGEIMQKGFKEMNWGDHIRQTSLRDQHKELMPIGPVEYLLDDGVKVEFEYKTEEGSIESQTCTSQRMKVYFCENLFSAIKVEFESTMFDFLKQKFNRELGFPRESRDLGDRHTEVWVVQPFRVEMVKEAKYLSVMVEYLPVNTRCRIRQ